MDIIIWLSAFLGSVLITMIERIAFTAKKEKNEKAIKINDLIVYLICILFTTVSVIFAIILKTKISYMYVCAMSVLILFNFLLSLLLRYLKKTSVEVFQNSK